MIKTAMRIEGLDRVAARLRRLGLEVGPAMQAMCMAIGELVRNRLAMYPGPAKKPVQWASEKQRRYYVAQRRQRGLGAYVRQSDPMSQRLGPGWTVTPYATMGAQVVAHATYAPFVQSKEMQQPMHKATGWKTDEQAIQEVQSSGDVGRVLDMGLKGLVR